MNKVAELQTKVEELTMANEYAVKLKEINHQEELKKIMEDHRQQMEAMKIKYDMLLQEKNDRERELDEKMQKLEDRFSQEKSVCSFVFILLFVASC